MCYITYVCHVNTFFKDRRYWKIDVRNMRLDTSRYPRRIGIDGFYHIPPDVNSVFVWSADQKIYFTKGKSKQTVIVTACNYITIAVCLCLCVSVFDS